MVVGVRVQCFKIYVIRSVVILTAFNFIRFFITAKAVHAGSLAVVENLFSHFRVVLRESFSTV